MNKEFWNRFASLMGNILAATVMISAWLIIVLFSINVAWFIVFRLFV